MCEPDAASAPDGRHDHTLGHETVVARVLVGGKVGLEIDPSESGLLQQALDFVFLVASSAFSKLKLYSVADISRLFP